MNLKHVAELRVEEAYRAAEEHYGRSFTRVPVIWSTKMTRVAGIAYFNKLKPIKIKLSKPLLDLNGPRFVDETPAHEAAHLIALELYGDVGHGPEWKEVMRAIGQEPNRLHSFKTPGITYTCNCQEVEFSKQRHNKIQRGDAKYTCRKCKAYFKQQGTQDTVKPNTVKTNTVKPKTETVYDKEIRVTKGKSKADTIRNAIRICKAEGMDRLAATRVVIRDLQQYLNMPTSAMRSSINHNWDRV